MPVTEPNTRGRQDALAAIKYPGDHFRLTNGNTLNTKDYFVSEERQRREAEIKDLERKKQKSSAVDDLNNKALALIEAFNTKQGKDVYELEDVKFLPVSTLRVLCEWKLQKKTNGKKENLVNLWMESKNNPPPESTWSDAEETLLKKLKEDDIQLKETALGRAKSKLQEQSVAYFLRMTEEERIAFNLPVELLDSL